MFLCLELQITFFVVNGLVIWLSSLAGRIVHIISMQDIYHNFLCNRWFSRLAKILDCKDCYFPYHISCLTLDLFCASLSATSWGYLLHVEHMSCVITNCVRHQWIIPSFLNASLGLTGMRIKCYQKIIILIFRDLFFKILLLCCFSYILCFPIIFHTSGF